MREGTAGRDIKHPSWDEGEEGGSSWLVAGAATAQTGGHLLVQWGPAGLVHQISGKCADRKGFPKKTEPTQRKS